MLLDVTWHSMVRVVSLHDDPYLALPLPVIYPQVHPGYADAAVTPLTYSWHGVLARVESYWLPILLPPALPRHVHHQAGQGGVIPWRDQQGGWLSAKLLPTGCS